MLNNKQKKIVKREEFLHYEGHLVYLILIIIFAISYPFWDLLSSNEILSFLSFGIFLALFAIIYDILFKWRFKNLRFRKK